MKYVCLCYVDEEASEAMTGFSHQSHLARHMRRVLGISPKAWKDATY